MRCRQSPPDYTNVDNRRGTVSFLAQGQAPGADAGLFTGSAVPLVDAVFRVKGTDAISIATTTSIQVGSQADPIFMSATSSNGDDISKSQDMAQV
jgi:hypothetical protein